MRRGFIDMPEGQLHYIEQGSGEALLLLNQSPRSVSMWRDAMPLLARRYRVIAFDLPGYGDSDPPPVANDVADVAAMGRSAIHLLDALGIAQAHLCGIHTGAYIAAQAAAQGGDRFRSLTLFGYPFIETYSEQQDFFAREGTARPIPTGRQADGSHMITRWMAGYAQVQKNWLLRGGPTDPSAEGENRRQPSPHRHAHLFMTDHELDVVERYVFDSPRARCMPQIYKVMIAPSSDLLRQIRIPARVVDLETPHESSFCRRGQRMVGVMPLLEARQLVGYDDNICEFSPEVFVAELADFLASHPIASSA